MMDRIQASPPAPGKPSKTMQRPAGPASLPDDVARRLAEVRAARTPADRLRATIQLASSIPVSELKAWFDAEWFDGEEDMQSHLFYRIARARLMAEDPAALVDYERRGGTQLHATVQEWATRDPEAALDYLMKIRDPDARSRLLSLMGRDLAKTDPELVLSRMKDPQFMLTANKWNVTSSIIEGLARSSPDALKAASKDWPQGMKEMVQAGLLLVSLKDNFSTTIGELGKSPDGMQRFLKAIDRAPDLANAAIKETASLPEGWFAAIATQHSYYLVQFEPLKWLDTDLPALGLTEEQAGSLRSEALDRIATNDPNQILSILSGPQLAPEERSKAIRQAIENLASDPEAAEAWIAKLSDEAEIQAARNALGKSRKGLEARQLTPSSFITNLTEEGTTVRGDYVQASSRWGTEERELIAKEFAALPEEKKSEVAGKMIENSHGEISPLLRADAIRYLLEHPPAADPEAPAGNPGTRLADAASYLAASWAEDDPNAAGHWVNALPAGQERLWAAKNLAARWNLSEPKAAQRWINTLSGDEQTQVRQHLDSNLSQGW